MLSSSISNGKSLSGDIFQYLKDQSLDNFDPPVDERELSFIKLCRFVDVNLSADGIITTGWLWTVYAEIEIRESARELQFDDPKKYYRGGLNQYQRWRLFQLADELEFRGYKSIAEDLDRYLEKDIYSNGYNDPPAKPYMDLMAEKVVDAIKKRKPVQLGCLMGRNPYSGIFVRESPCQNSPRSQRNKESYAFTAWSPTRSDDRLRKRRIDKIVSLEVSLDGCTERNLPRLRTKQWMNGLCFFDRCSPKQVVFPWPSSLEG